MHAECQPRKTGNWLTISGGWYIGKIKSPSIIPNLVGWWLTYPSEKYDFVSWDDEIPNIWKVIKFHGSSHHQPEIKLAKPPSGMISPSKKMSITRLMNTASFTMALLILGPWPILQAAKAGMRSQSSTSSTSHTFEDSQVLCYKNPLKTSQTSMLKSLFDVVSD